MSRCQLILLPGFLGESRDFSAFSAALAELQASPSDSMKGLIETQVFDWLDQAPELLQTGLDRVAAPLWTELQKLKVPNVEAKFLSSWTETRPELWILGYSLGGRLALSLWHYLRKNPQVGRARFIFVSTNPGLSSQMERNERMISDRAWAERFRIEEWGPLLRAWNQQAVFAGSVQEPDRSRRQKQRELLAQCLLNWSLAKQPDYREELSTAQDYLWITGGKDLKFTHLAEGLQNTKTIPQASHRVPMDAPKELAGMVFAQYCGPRGV